MHGRRVGYTHQCGAGALQLQAFSAFLLCICILSAFHDLPLGGGAF